MLCDFVAVGVAVCFPCDKYFSFRTLVCLLFFLYFRRVEVNSKMKIIHNRIIPPKRFSAINLFGVLFCRKGRTLSTDVIQHERIHTAQMRETLFLGFYVWYLIEWLARIPMKGNAYHNISMEREAYENMDDPDYLLTRRPYAWVRYLKKKA